MPTLVVFSRYPVAGETKTRLIPALGPEGAASLQREMSGRVVLTARTACARWGAALQIAYTGGTRLQVEHWLGRSIECREQPSGDLGERLHASVEQCCSEGDAVVIVGTDCPFVSPKRIHEAFAALVSHDVVLGPAEDGGYYLVGLKRPVPELFRGISWGTADVLKQTLVAASTAGLSAMQLGILPDVDRPSDLAAWEALNAREATRSITVVIPALNEAQEIGRTVALAAAVPDAEVIVVDGGSTDDTRNVAACAGARVIEAPPGRAAQQNSGALAARGRVLLFLHADTWLPAGYDREAARILAAPGRVAGAYRFRIRGRGLGLRLVEAMTHLRSRWKMEPYGDQGLFIERRAFFASGGFAHMPLMEDLEFVERMRRQGRVETSSVAAGTSSRRWKALGWVRTTWINQRILRAYRRGVSSDVLVQWYRGEGTG